MKKTIDDAAGIASVFERLSHLNSQSQRLWGTMEVHEMLWHCRAQLVLALGEKQSKRLNSVISKWPFNRLAIYLVPWKKNLRTAREMNAKKEENAAADFKTERNLLVHYLEKAKAAKTLEAHPLLGDISRTDWGYLIYKHIDHHLRQFGV